MLQNDIIIGRLVLCHYNHICCEIVGVLASSAVERGFSRVNPKTITLVFAASPIDRHNYGLRLRTKTGWSG